MARVDTESAAAPRRRPRGSLSREEILEAGLLIARRDELTRLTMKKLAEQLGVTPMAIYRHFENKAEVVDGVLDLFVREAAVTVIPFLGTASRFGPAAMAVLDTTLGVLRQAGMSRREAVEIFAVLCAYTIGAAGLASTSRAMERSDDPDEGWRQTRLVIESMPRGDFPEVVDGASALAGMLQHFPFDVGLESLLQRKLPN